MYLLKDKKAVLRFSFLILGLIVIASIIFVASGVFAGPDSPTVSYDTIGTGATATLEGCGVKLYTPDGGVGSAYVRLEIPDGIELDDINSLSYTAKVTTSGAGGFAPEVVLNIDADEDDSLEGTGVAWMTPAPSHNPASLGYVDSKNRGDNFLSGDNNPKTATSVDAVFVNRDALGNYSYWAANDTRTGFGSLYNSFSAIVPGMLPVHEIDSTDKVYSIDFVVGTSGNFNDMEALFSSVELNGVTYFVLPDDEGPLTSDVDVDPWFNNGVFDLTATATDECSAIKTATYYFGKTGSPTCDITLGGVTGTIYPQDGSFDLDKLQEILEELNFGYNEDGLNWVCIQSEDSEDNIGNCACISYQSDTYEPEEPINVQINGVVDPDELLVCGADPTLTAEIWDTQSPIQGGEYFLNQEIPPYPDEWDGDWMDVIENWEEDQWHKGIIQAIIDLDNDKVVEGTNYIKLRGKDDKENWGKMLDYYVSFIKDTTPPETTKEIAFAGDKSVICQYGSANGKTLTDGCYYVLPGATITLSATDPDPQGTGEFAGDEIIHYNVWYSTEDDCSTATIWALNQSGTGLMDEDVIITLEEDSCHLIEYWATDGCSNEEDHHFELDIVDSKAPKTTKTVGEPKISGEGYPIEYYITDDTTITLDCEDQLPHPVGGEILNWWLYWSESCDDLNWDLIDSSEEHELSSSVEITDLEDSCHLIKYYCVDALGNTEFPPVQEIDAVDNQPPVIEKEIIGPHLACEEEIEPVLCEKWGCFGQEDLKDFFVTGRYGVPGPGDWELAIWNGQPEQVEKQKEYVWTNGQWVDFSLNYNPSTGLVTYTVGGTILTWTYDSGKAFEYIIPFVKGNLDGNIAELTNMELNGISLSDITSDNGLPYYWGLKVPLTDAQQVNGFTLTGKAKLTWSGTNTIREQPAFHVFAMNTHDPEPEDCYYIDGVTEIHVNATDPEPHPSNNVMCDWWYVWDSQEYEGGINVTPPFIISGWNESRHDLYIECWDALGNAARDVELFIVDKTPPTTTKEYIGPYFEDNGTEWIDGITKINLTVDDTGPHKSGIKETKYRVTLVNDDACWDNVECQKLEGSEEWQTYTEPFNDIEESCHLIEYYSVDNVNKKETVNKQCVFVDNKYPKTDKEIGEPRYACEEFGFEYDQCGPEGQWLAWYVNSSTPITLSCEDQLPHPVDHEVLCYRVSLDDGREPVYITQSYYVEGGWLEDKDTYCVNVDENGEFEFYFKEESLHNLEWYCKDALGNTGVEQIEWDNVDDTPPQIIVHNPTPEEAENVTRCTQSIVIEAWDEKSGVNDSSIYAELINDSQVVVEHIHLTKEVYGTYRGLMGKEHPVGWYTLKICASDNLGNQYCEEIQEYLPEMVNVDFIDPSVCIIDPKTGGTCDFAFNLCMRDGNSLQFWMNKLGIGGITPDEMNALVSSDLPDEAFVGLKHPEPQYTNKQDCENAPSFVGEYVWEDGICYWQSDAEILSLEVDPICHINGKDVFNLHLEIGSDAAGEIGTGVHDLEYWIKTFVWPSSCGED